MATIRTRGAAATIVPLALAACTTAPSGEAAATPTDVTFSTTPVALGPPQPVPAAWFGDPGAGPAVGIISTSAGPAPPFPATWDFLEVTPAT